MKITFFFLLLLFIPLVGIGQSYKKTLKAEKRWQIHESNTGMGGSSNFDYVTTCDTLINSKQYYRIDRITSLSTPYSNLPLLGFTREDTSAKQVYYLPLNTTQEELIVDYTLTVGDSFTFAGYTLPVELVDTLFINGDNRKVIHFYGYNLGGPYHRFIEGVGDGFWGVYKEYPSFSSQEAVGLIDENSGVSCGNIMPIQQILAAEQVIQVYPNPFSQNIHIEVDDKNVSIKENQIGIVYDSMGKSVYTFEFSPQEDVDLRALAAGVYCLKIEGCSPIRLIKQN